MSYTRQNSFIQFDLDFASGRWSLSSQQRRGPWLEGIDMSIRYRQGRGTFRVPLSNLFLRSEREEASTLHGTAQTLRLVTPKDRRGVRCSISFSLPQNYPILLWKLNVENLGKQPIHIDRLELLNIGFLYAPDSVFTPTYLGPMRGAGAGHLILAVDAGEPAFFSNGWQSWNYTGAYGWKDRQRRTRLGPFTSPMRINAGTPQPTRPGLFSSDMFGVIGDRQHRTGLLAGFLSQKQHFGSLEAFLHPSAPALRMWANGDNARLDPAQEMETDWACLNYLDLDTADPLSIYMEAVARENGIREVFPTEAIPTGWCSWYHFFQNVSEKDILENLEEISRRRDSLPLQLVQIDDGFEAQIGDWTEFSPTFPNGVKPLANKIRESGFTPGLWLAPFIVHPKSRLAKEHPEWLLRGRMGRPVNAGFIWDTFTGGLDLTAPGALEYAASSVERAVNEWGFPFLKLDFLYAAALPGRYHDPTRTRAQVLRTGLEALRLAAGVETTLLGCGCPLGSALGLVEAMRIGSDVDSRWKPTYKGIDLIFKDEPDMPSARNSIHNALSRAPMHRRWWINDPDCLLLRGNTLLTENEVKALASVIALSGGALLLSDHLPEVSADRMQIATALLPVLGKRPYVLDWFDSATPSRLQINMNGPEGNWHLLGLFNWEDSPRDFMLRLTDFYLEPGKAYLARSFWDGQLYTIGNTGKDEHEAGEVLLKDVPPHAAVILALRSYCPSQPRYLGSSFHISQGIELDDWDWDGAKTLLLKLARPGKAMGEVVLALPSTPRKVVIDDQEGEAKTIGNNLSGFYRITLSFDKTVEIKLTL